MSAMRLWQQGGNHLLNTPSRSRSQRTAPIQIRVDRALTHPQVVDLQREHLAGMHAESPPDEVLELDRSALRQPQITLQGEIKSMPTAARHLRQGAGRVVLAELLSIARRRGYARASLETCTTPGIDTALTMYQRFGLWTLGHLKITGWVRSVGL